MSKTALLGIFLVANIFANETKTLSSNDKEIVIQVKSDYVMGDGDSRIDAKSIALQQAENLASEYAGTFVKSELIIENDAIKKEQISTITTALMSVNIIDELYSITKDNRTKLVLTVNTTLDKQSFIDKLKSLTQDKEKQTQIISLQKENDKLKEKLFALNNKIEVFAHQEIDSEGFATISHEELYNERKEVLSNFENNKNAIKKIFGKGTLLSMAMKSTSDFEDSKNDIDQNVFKYIKNNTKITIGDLRILPNKNGTYDITVPLHWEHDTKKIKETLSKYFEVDNIFNSCKNVSVEVAKNNDATKSIFSEKLFTKFDAEKIDLRISLGKEYYEDIRLLEDAASGKCLETRGDAIVIFRGVSKKVLQNLTAIDASIIGNDTVVERVNYMHLKVIKDAKNNIVAMRVMPFFE